MGTAEKISVVLPPEVAAIVRGAVATGEYASSSEVIRDALRDWAHKRGSARRHRFSPGLVRGTSRRVTRRAC